MAYLLMALQAIVGIAWLVCFIMVLIKMFQQGQTGLGIACIVLVFCVGIGGLIAFIFGWINAQKWPVWQLAARLTTKPAMRPYSALGSLRSGTPVALRDHR